MELGKYNFYDSAEGVMTVGADGISQCYGWFTDAASATSSYYTLITGLDENEITNLDSNIVEFELAGKQLYEKVDQLSVREKLKVLIATKMGVVVDADWQDQTKFDLLTDDEKLIGCDWDIIKHEPFQLQVNSDPIYWDKNSEEYEEWTKEIYKTRGKQIDRILFRRIVNQNDVHEIRADKISLFEFYKCGIVCIQDHGQEALRDYFNSEAGTSYENNGFREVLYSFNVGHTADTTAYEILNIIDGD